MPNLTEHERREVAVEVWKLFCLMAEKVELFFTENGVSITVRFQQPHKLGDHVRSVGGVIRGFHDYNEVETAALVALPSEHDS